MGQLESIECKENQMLFKVYEIRQDGCVLLKHRYNGQEYLLRTFCTNLQDEIVQFYDLMQRRKVIQSIHLLKIQQIHQRQIRQKCSCSIQYKLYVLIEHPFQTLKDQIMLRTQKKTKNYFSEDQLISLLYSCCISLKTLYENQLMHEALDWEQILLNKNGIIQITDPIIMGLKKNYVYHIKNQRKRIHISPEIINFLEDYNFCYYDKQKSDVFILGIIILEAGLLKQIDCFRAQTKSRNISSISECFKQFTALYSQKISTIVLQMLQLEPFARLNFNQIVLLIQNQAYDHNITNSEIQIHNMNNTPYLMKHKNPMNNKILASRSTNANINAQRQSMIFSHKNIQNKQNNSVTLLQSSKLRVPVFFTHQKLKNSIEQTQEISPFSNFHQSKFQKINFKFKNQNQRPSQTLPFKNDNRQYMIPSFSSNLSQLNYTNLYSFVPKINPIFSNQIPFISKILQQAKSFRKVQPTPIKQKDKEYILKDWIQVIKQKRYELERKIYTNSHSNNQNSLKIYDHQMDQILKQQIINSSQFNQNKIQAFNVQQEKQQNQEIIINSEETIKQKRILNHNSSNSDIVQDNPFQQINSIGTQIKNGQILKRKSFLRIIKQKISGSEQETIKINKQQFCQEQEQKININEKIEIQQNPTILVENQQTQLKLQKFQFSNQNQQKFIQILKVQNNILESIEKQQDQSSIKDIKEQENINLQIDQIKYQHISILEDCNIEGY